MKLAVYVGERGKKIFKTDKKANKNNSFTTKKKKTQKINKI